jgi:hypothetical protein
VGQDRVDRRSGRVPRGDGARARTRHPEGVLPMLMFAIVLGLLMDCEVFLLSRVHEAWVATSRTCSWRAVRLSMLPRRHRQAATWSRTVDLRLA